MNLFHSPVVLSDPTQTGDKAGPADKEIHEVGKASRARDEDCRKKDVCLRAWRPTSTTVGLTAHRLGRVLPVS